jgi:threonine/homoserine/homoserine lactone efflux protein
MLNHLLLYLLAVLTLSLFPGPDMLYIISQSLSHGKRFGLAAALGVGTGCFVHIFAVTIGLSSILLESSLAFTIIKYLGASYLFYIGVMSLLKKQAFLPDKTNTVVIASWKKTFMQGLLTNVLNPKVALFFLAFLPQFVMPGLTQSMSVQLLILGLIFNLLGTTVNILIALSFGAIKHWLADHPIALTLQQKITGMILIGLSIRLAAFEKG